MARRYRKEDAKEERRMTRALTLTNANTNSRDCSLFFLIPQILIGSITLLQKFTPPFPNPGSAPETVLKI